VSSDPTLLFTPYWVQTGLKPIQIESSSLDLPAWVQAVGSVAAILLAIWTTTAAERQRQNERIVDDACFATYISDFLTTSTSTVVKLADRIDNKKFKNRASEIPAAYRLALRQYDNLIIKRAQKLIDLPLTDWPDIELANAFYDTFLVMGKHFQEIVSNNISAQSDALLREEERIQKIASRLRRSHTHREQLIEELGDSEDDEIIDVSDLANTLRAVGSNRGDEDFSEHFLQDEAYFDDIEDREDADSERYAKMVELIEKLKKPLVDLPNYWRYKGSPLTDAISRYQNRALERGLPASYEERAEPSSFLIRYKKRKAYKNRPPEQANDIEMPVTEDWELGQAEFSGTPRSGFGRWGTLT